MRHDLAHDSRSCLGCGRMCADPYSFCGRCMSASRAPKSGLSPRMRNVIFRIVFFGVAALACWVLWGLK
jgi:hypothetical protein